ncbi:MAG: hypothetical protein JSS02_22975 [Planctomycetes bacterium]|nr:hypothetical protein [Planctomycetota bacterium]
MSATAPRIQSLSTTPARTTWFVWLSWAALTLLTGGLILWFGIRVPFWDEWDGVVPFLTGERPINWQTLWAPHNEHRILIPRLILIGLDRLTGHEFRAGMFLSWALMSATSAGLLWLIRRIRGTWVWSDAFFPALLLNWGHAANLVMSFQVQLVIAGCFGCLAAALFADCERPTKSRLICLGLMLALWPLCSAAGIACGLALAPFFAACVWWKHDYRTPVSRGTQVLALALLLIIPVECLLTYVPRAALHPAATDKGLLVRHVILEFGMAFGAIVRVIGYPVALLSLTLSAAALWWLWHGTDQSRSSRLARFGVALVLLAHLGLAAAIAWGRSGMGERAVLAARYFTLICPLLVAIYLAAVRCAPDRWKHIVTAGLCVVQFLLYPAYVVAGWSTTAPRKEHAEALAQEISQGVPLPELVKRHTGFFFASDEYFAMQLRRLHDARIGIFTQIQLESPTAGADAPARKK